MDNRHRGRDKDYDRFDRNELTDIGIGDRGFGFGMGSMMGSMGGMKRGSSEKFTAKIRVYEKCKCNVIQSPK